MPPALQIESRASCYVGGPQEHSCLSPKGYDKLKPRDPTGPSETFVSATGEEVNLGFLEGPFTEKEVSDFFHTDDWNCIRRFLILQGAEKKPRPIDDGHEALINCYTSMIKLELQSSDFVTCMAKTLARCESERAKAKGTSFRRWLGKCLDLSKAYKRFRQRRSTGPSRWYITSLKLVRTNSSSPIPSCSD